MITAIRREELQYDQEVLSLDDLKERFAALLDSERETIRGFTFTHLQILETLDFYFNEASKINSVPILCSNFF